MWSSPTSPFLARGFVFLLDEIIQRRTFLWKLVMERENLESLSLWLTFPLGSQVCPLGSNSYMDSTHTTVPILLKCLCMARSWCLKPWVDYSSWKPPEMVPNERASQLSSGEQVLPRTGFLWRRCFHQSAKMKTSSPGLATEFANLWKNSLILIPNNVWSIRLCGHPCL